MNDSPPAYQVNEYAPDRSVRFDREVAEKYVLYAHRLAARGYVQSTLGGMVIRVRHDNHPDGLAYAKPAGVSLEEMSVDDVVITDIPYGRVIHGTAATSVGDTNCIVMKRHGITVLGRDVSECYHRVNVYASEVKRQIIVETLCAAKGTTPDYIGKEEMEWMFSRGDGVVYPTLIRKQS